VNLSGLLGIGGGGWANAVISTLSGGRAVPLPDAATSEASALAVNTGSTAGAAADAIRNAMRNAASSLRSAFSTFDTRTRPTFTASVVHTGSAARVTGVAARVAAIDASYAVLRATAAVNTQTSTERSSSSAIGLDLSTAASTILSATPAFSGVTTGSFSVNGVSIAVDAGVDTLQDVLARVSAAGADVTARYDSAADAVVFSPSVSGATLALDSDTTGFLSAANVAAGAAGTRLNATAAFNATGLDAPLFDPGISVQAGSFTVNGVAIAVAASDTVTSVLGRITASAAGVTATYDAATQKVSLANSSGTLPIALGADTSGFLAAVKLDGTAQAGTEAQTASAYTTALIGMPEYSGVQAGTLTVNSQSIAVNPSTMTINGLLEAINAIADVSATVDEGSGIITISSLQRSTTLTLADTSGLLSTLGIAPGTYAGSAVSSKVVETLSGTTTVTNSSVVAAKAAVAIDQLNAALAQVGSDRASLQEAVDSLRDAGVEGLSVDGDAASARIVMNVEALAAGLVGFRDEATLTSVVTSALDGLTDRMAASARTHAFDQEQARQRLAVEQTQTALLFRTQFRPRSPEGAARIQSAPAGPPRAERKKPVQKEEEEKVAPLPVLPTLATVASAATDLLRPLLDLFADGASAARHPDRRSPTAAWWQWNKM
jgi:flagellar hook-associated protein 2